jgi:hypothetical protein
MAIRLLNEAPDDFQINNLSYSFRVKPYLSFHIVTGIDQRLAFYTIYRVHLHIISSFKIFLVETLKDYKPSKPSKDYIESGSADDVDNIPNYAYYSSQDQQFRWRDLYTYGFIDNLGRGVNYPFLNSAQYPYSNIVFRLIPEGTNVNLTGINFPNKPFIDECE